MSRKGEKKSTVRTLRCAIYTRKSTEEGLDQEFNSLDAQREAGFPSEQTMLFGFSQGCLMTLETGFRYPHRLAGMVGVSGHVHDPEQLLTDLAPVAREQRALVTHGTHDPLIPCAGVREQIAVLQMRGLNIQWKEYHKVHTIDGAQEVGEIRAFVRTCFGEP